MFLPNCFYDCCVPSLCTDSCSFSMIAAKRPAIKTVKIDTQLLVNGPRRLSLDVPGTTVVITRRDDLTPPTPQAPAVAAAGDSPSSSGNSSTPAPVSTWVGEVFGIKGGASSVVLISAEDRGVYGRISYIDRRTRQRRTFKVCCGAQDTATVALQDEISIGAMCWMLPRM